MRRHGFGDAGSRRAGLARFSAVLFFLGAIGVAVAVPNAVEPPPAGLQQSAPVAVDGRTLFTVIGVPAYPAKTRARMIAGRIQAIADDPGFQVERLRAEQEKDQTWVVADDKRLFAIVDADARLQGLDRPHYVSIVIGAIGDAVARYRLERTADVVVKRAAAAAGAVALLVLFLWATRWLLRRLLASAQRRFRVELEKLEARSSGVVDAERFESVLLGSAKASWWLLAAAAIFACVDSALELFPWTRGAARWLFELVLSPLQTMLNGLMRSIPDLVFLAILYFVVRYLLRILELFFTGVGRGAIRLAGFAPEWAIPTYKLARMGIVAFALVVAYPYIPGSSTDAFKGISVFVGVLVSLGSSSIIANTLAGYALLYRRTFSLGEWVKIGAHTGSISAIEQQVARLRTVHNEEVVIPNSLIVQSEVVNYSRYARAGGLLLHSTVSIGYDAPWRQVEALLLEAARRTEGLLKTPEPFVRKLELDDFYVKYQINAYCDDAGRMSALYSELHANIIDEFNKHGVQIMSPHFLAQPGEPVVVPKAKWFEPPAKPPDR